MKTVRCSQCNKSFKTTNHRVKEKNYCSRACYANARKARKLVHCSICNAPIEVKKSSIGKYCSRECAAVGYIESGKALKVRKCVVCEKEFKQAYFMDITCSTQCDILYYDIKPMFTYKAENVQKVGDIALRTVDPALGF